jgi:hypothetical protein
MFRRRVAFTDATLSAVAKADAVAANTFPFDNPEQVAALVEAMRQATGLTVVDANPRPGIIADRIAFRNGAEKVFACADIAKISDEDAELLYGGNESHDVAPGNICFRWVRGRYCSPMVAKVPRYIQATRSRYAYRSPTRRARSKTRWAPAMQRWQQSLPSFFAKVCRARPVPGVHAWKKPCA